MTKEELEKEAEESFEQYKVTDEDYVVSPYSDDMGEKMLMYNDEYYAEETYLRFYTQGYLASAEPREKQIAELEDKLANADYQLEGRDVRIAELEAQIEEMKCCANCQTVRDAEGNCYLKKDGKCKDKDKWELRR